MIDGSGIDNMNAFLFGQKSPSNNLKAHRHSSLLVAEFLEPSSLTPSPVGPRAEFDVDLGMSGRTCADARNIGRDDS
jgi:hypothetical protein